MHPDNAGPSGFGWMRIRATVTMLFQCSVVGVQWSVNS